MQFLAVPKQPLEDGLGFWLRLCEQDVPPPLMSPSSTGLAVAEHDEFWVEGSEPHLRPVLGSQELFTTGEILEVMVGHPGEHFGLWVPVEILSKGDWPKSYHLKLLQQKMASTPGKEERVSNVPMWYLRRPSDHETSDFSL
eukprot:TRINITY_DN29311_c0_g1_i1.p1 TRINITY_DN29311_c0_g1~~TRINITY_DN29311_c0_g1_i1.p1  ORF type:complete len:141 (+),score=18.37 TRINITY_DN29311_c0_g1_i1:231-653(+)